MQDEDYMRQLSFGNDSALDTLVFRYHKPLYGYVYRLLQDEKLAEDIVQDTFMKIYQQGQKGDLFLIILNHGCTKLRQIIVKTTGRKLLHKESTIQIKM